MVDVGAEEFVGAFDGLVDLRVFDAEFLGQGDEEETTVTGGVQSAVAGVHAVELTTVEGWIGEGMAPATAGTLAHCRFDGKLAQGGQDKFVASSLIVEGAVEASETHVPTLVASSFARLEQGTNRLLGRVPLLAVFTTHPVVYDLAVFRFSGGDQGDGF